MVGVVEEQGEVVAAPPEPADLGDQGGVVPLVDDDEVGAVHHRLEVRAGGEAGRAQLGIGVAPGLEPLLAMVLAEILEAPGAFRFVGLDVVAERDQLAQHAAQEVGVAVVPAGGEAVGEVDDPHAAALGAADSVAARTGRCTAGSRPR